MVDLKKVEIKVDGDDIWLNGDLISKCGGNDEWTAFFDNGLQEDFETLEQAIAYCLEPSHD